ncbi:aromatic ring-hydroxylating dioxygenase subunit alpha [Pigmentiphaga sp.]|uniref:aromatic ring-hydroxylating dioxygenase subunit alpha n=1 Tax=Pigmentiphaga sp. TaxID=1977564 RepID=UPI002600ECA4|nr:aromatic ring-hydroxylating dioxygenase subunit alpha [Pigmentiphaga sp.]
MWMKNAWYVAAFSKEVHTNLLARTFLGTRVVLYRQEDGQVAALEDSCAHRRLPLSFGHVENDRLVCGYHGMSFGADGKCTGIPGQERIPPAARVRAFPIQERHDLIWIWLGDPALAGQSSPPDAGRMKHPDWVPSAGYCHLEADYRLLNDNLLDLSHVAFVHGRTIGNTAVAQSPIKVSQQGNVVSVHRDVVGAHAPPFYAHLGGFRQPIHRWHTVNYHAPSTCIIEVGCEAMQPGDGLGRIEGVVMHLITPETEDSSHYFWAFIRRFRQDEPALTEYIRQAIDATHTEDKVVVELQHAALTAPQRENPVNLAIVVDSGPLRGRRLLEELIQQEPSAPAPEPVPAHLAG